MGANRPRFLFPMGASSSSSPSNSSKRRRSYDVFLSFRGKDVRNNFLGHLYAALDQRGINTYMDDEELRIGEEISSALMKAIEESQIAIVVFSKDYASSTWCLDELAKIMDCKEQKHLEVIPLFYKVDPREVRTPRDSYFGAMAEHEIKFGKDSEKVKRWKNALWKAGNLSGEHFTDRSEAELIQRVVREISVRLDRTPLHVAKYPVGLDSRVREFKTILNLQSKDDVLMVGLWGQGGVGKTTLATAIYDDVFREFQGSCFLERVRENSKSYNDFVALQGNLLSQVLPGKEFKVYSVAQGSCLIQDRLRHKKVLIILDDVDDAKQLNALAGNRQWFGNGSMIIITTRNKDLLISHDISLDHMYEVKVLKDGEARKLFRQYAFPGNRKIEIRRNLVDDVLYYAGGLPLALVVLGSSLCRRGEGEWESTLQKLSKIPDKDINDVLKVSYDGLDDYQKEIFLDIACFFKGQSTEYTKKVLDSCYDFDTTIGVKILMERSLIRGEYGTLQMHDLIQSMGMDIVMKEYRDYPEKRSRLWLHDDVLDVLSGESGTDAIKAIVLKLQKPERMHIGRKAFKKMKKLRLLILHNVHNSFQGPIHLPNELRWFEWPHCASIPEFRDGPKKLVGLDLRNTNIEVVLKQFQDFKKLKFINFNECQSLVCMPDLSYTPNLEELDLSGCNNLEHVHTSLAYHGELKSLNLSGCSELHALDVLLPKSLRCLILANCSKLQRFPNGLDKAKGLRELDLKGTSIEELPVSIGSLVFLERMNLRECKELTILPSSIYRLRNLRNLNLSGCSKLTNFPKKEGDSSDPDIKTGFPSLWWLDLSNCNLLDAEFLENPSWFPILDSLCMEGNKFTYLPTTRDLSLTSLDVAYCEQLQEIHEIPSRLWSLRADGCKSLTKIPTYTRHGGTISLSMCKDLVCNGFTINDFFKLETIKVLFKLQDLRACNFKTCLPGGEMPEWLVPNNEGYISFMLSKDLYDKLIGVASCVVFRGNGGRPAGFFVSTSVNGKTVQSDCTKYIVDSDHVGLCLYRLGRERDYFGPNHLNHVQVHITSTHGNCIVKKCGFRLIFKLRENDLDVLLQHNPLLDRALLHIVRHDDSPTSTVQESSNATEVLPESKTSTEENTVSNLVLKGSYMAHFSLQRWWVEHEDNQTNTEGSSSNEGEGLQGGKTSTEEDSWSTEEESNVADFSIERWRYSQMPSYFRKVHPVHPGEEMPEKFVPVEDGTICFMASQDLYDGLMGLALCVVFCVEDGEKEVSFDIVPHIDGQQRNVLSGTLGSFDSDHMWYQVLRPHTLWGFCGGTVDFGQFDEKELQFSLTLKVSGGTMKKLGYVIRSWEQAHSEELLLEDINL